MNGYRLVCGALLLVGLCEPAEAQPPDNEIAPRAALEFFETQVRPLLVARCQKCHGASAPKGGLSLASRASFASGGDSGPVVVPGKPEESLLIDGVQYTHDHLQMPPDGKLPAADIARLVRWVQEGAHWSPAADDPAAAAPLSPRVITPQDRSFWSFQPVREVEVPAVEHTQWPHNAIDHFILARLERKNLRPALPADKRTLLRRATFDLTGLPPTPDEIRAFLADDSPTAFAQVVDRLLASPAYGQRWGRHWLDVVRYADARDLIQLPAESDFREAWRYRDWVVDAFNRDLPYSEFLMQQIAGDLLQPTDATQIDAGALVATGFLAIADFVPGDVNKEQMIADYVNDQVDVLSKAFLGLTVACARCHDHKFDPITTEDYYALAGIFFSTRLVPGPIKGNTPLVRAPLLPPAELQAIEEQTARDKQRLAELGQEVQFASEREQRAVLEHRAAHETAIYALAAWEYLHPATDAAPSTTAEFAAAHKLQETLLARWLKYLGERPHAAFAPLLAAVDKQQSACAAQALGQSLADVATKREALRADPTIKTLVDAELLRLQADDPRIVTDEAGHITSWPDRGGLADDAAAVPATRGPALSVATIGGHSRRVVHFEGQELLAASRAAPAVGSLFVVFRAAPTAPAGQRLIGWEDAAVGQHGVGLIANADGSLHAVLRHNGASGDLVAPASAAQDFQCLCITWGPAGTALYRDGAAVVTNQGLNAVSSDPAIGALRMGGAGSGAGPSFCGELAELRVYGVQLDDAARARVVAELQDRWFNMPRTDEPQSDPAAEVYDELLSSRGPFYASAAEREQLLPAAARQRLADLRAELETLKKKPAPDIPRAVVVQEGGPPDTKHAGFQDAPIYLRGNPANAGRVVPRGFPRVLAGDEQPPIRTGSGRRELAAWLARADHPLTARVMVNRIWQQHFGEGLVRTSINFGVRGERPSHSELLDYLAGQFVASGWSVKALHRLIMLSSAYAQSSRPADGALAEDPENRLVSRMNRRRLEAEAIRDSLLAVAGRLDTTAGGPAFAEVTTPRRSLYLMAARTGAKTAEFSPLFDAPDCGAVVEKRNQSTVAPQALFLMNDPFVIDLAAALAERVLREAPDESAAERIGRLYEIALGRLPTPAEIAIGQQLVADRTADDAWPRYCHVLLCTNEFLYVD